MTSVPKFYRLKCHPIVPNLEGVYKSFLLFTLFLAPVALAAKTRDLPLWEFGVGALPFRADNYRGSPQNKWYFLPLLSYTYRGKNVEAENGYVRGHLVRAGKFTLDLSVALGLNVNSDSDRLRYGMRDLDPTIELGPMVRYYLWKSADENHYINLEMPYRAAYMTNLTYADHVGYYSIPYVNYLARPRPATFGWSVELSLGPQYGSGGYHHHFYGVNFCDVRPERPEYRGRRGYGGTSLGLVLSKRLGPVLVLPFFRYDYLDGAVYDDSPLFANRNYTFFGVGIVWYFARSEKGQQAPTMVK
jgi:outer membrane protein